MNLLLISLLSFTIAILIPALCGWLLSNDNSLRISEKSISILLFFAYFYMFSFTFGLQSHYFIIFLGIAILLAIYALYKKATLNYHQLLVLLCGTFITIPYLIEFPISQWDGYFIWLPRYLAIKEFHSPEIIRNLDLAQQTYPFLGPAIWALTDPLQSTSLFQIGRVAFGLIFISSLICIYDWASSLATAIIIGILFFRLEIFSGYQDYTITILLAVGLGQILFRKYHPSSPVLWSPIALFKTEGIVLFFLLIGTHIIFHRKSIKPKDLLWALLSIPIAFGWQVATALKGADITNIQNHSFDLHRLTVYSAERIGLISQQLADYLKKDALVAAVALVSFIRHRKQLYPHIISLCLYVLFLFVTFYCTIQPIEWHLATAFERLAFHLRAWFLVAWVVTMPGLIATAMLKIKNWRTR
jgi:hypothetical protein